MTLGELIDTLKSFPKDYLVVIKPYDLVPNGFDSYRGYYDELALEYDIEGHCTVEDLLKIAKKVVGKELMGYKGGNFLMTKNTPVWISNYGNTSNMLLTKVESPFTGYVYIYGEYSEVA